MNSRPPGFDGRHFSSFVTGRVAEHVAATCGDDALVAMLAANDLPSREELSDWGGWCTYDETMRLLAGAAELLGGLDGVRAAAATLGRLDVAAPIDALTSPADVLKAVAQLSAKFATVLPLEAAQVDDAGGLIVGRSSPGFPRNELICAFTAGVLMRAGELFGLTAIGVVEERCEVRGDDHCAFRVTFPPHAAASVDELARCRAQLDRATRTVENLQSTVRDLVSGADVDMVLARITDRASHAVVAPQYLLAVAPEEGDAPRVHQLGFDRDEAATRAAELLADDDAEDPSRLVVDVSSGERRYGKLAAFNPGGVAFLDSDRALFAAYAELAAVALDVATSLEESHRQRCVAEALLDLGRALSRGSNTRDVAQRLADAVPKTVGSTSASVFMYDAERGSLRATATSGMPDAVAERVMAVEIGDGDTPLLGAMVRDQEPLFLSRPCDDPYIVGLLDVTGSHTAVVLPICFGGRFRGIITASRTDDGLRPTPEILQRLEGIADQGATALHNAELHDAVQHQALHDALTDTANQRLLQDRADLAIRQARRQGHQVAMLCLDLDRFKVVNDTLGHSVGDLLIAQVANRLKGSVRDVDTVARLGGDEFAVLLPGLAGADEAALVAARMEGALEQPFHIDGFQLFVRCSIGIAVHPHHADGYGDLRKAADIAMYQAKAAGGGAIRAYNPSMVIRSPDALSLETDLHGAAGRGELRALFQPLVDLRTMRIVDAEALIRWQHPRLGLLTPDVFLPLAEESGMITELDTWMLRTACHQLAAWRSAGLDIGVAVNVSDRDLRDVGFGDRVEAALVEAGVAPDRLELEITERVAESIGPHAEAMLTRLSGLGVRLAVDDFGTGNSAFGRLTDGRIDTLKIDRSFLGEIVDEASPAPLVRALIELGHTLGVRIVAEGVETPAQAAFIRRHGCDLAQGFLFSRPLDPAAFADLARAGLVDPFPFVDPLPLVAG